MLCGVGGQHHAAAASSPENRAGTHYIGGWEGPWTGLDGCGKSRPTEIRSPDCPAHSESLYRLSYPSAQGLYHVCMYVCICLYIYKENGRDPITAMDR
jgi:hypothetical protein